MNRVCLVAAAALVACAPGATESDAGAGTCSVGRVLLAPELINARDLGGIPVDGASAVTCGHLLRAAAPGRLTTTGCERFAGLGIKTIVDLREPSERANVPNADCVTATTQLVTAPLPIPFNVSPTDYLADLHSDDSVRKVFATLGDEAAYPVLFHCTYGRDRTGVIAALALGVLGVSREEIERDYLRTNAAGFSTTPASLMAVTNALAAEGGAEAHLLSIGVSPDALATLKRVASTPAP